MEEKEALKRILERERKARKTSERILEEKSLELYQANQELKNLYSSLENRYQKIVEQANDIIYRGDDKGYCIFVNSIASRILGYKREELIGKHFTELVVDDQLDKVSAFYIDQRKNLQENTYYEFEVKTKDGHRKWLGQNVSLIIEKGKIIGTSAVARDITEQKQAEEQVKRNEKKYISIIENMKLGLLEVDPEGLVVSANSRFTEMTGYAESDLVGLDPSSILLKEDQTTLVSEKNAERKKGKSSVYELKAYKKSGEEFWMMISGAPRFDKTGHFVGSIGIHMDITQQKKLLNQLEVSKKMAEDSSKAKEVFLAHMSHEIRTPLNSVLGMIHLLQDTDPNPEQKEYLKSIQYSSEVLLNIISDILDISKIEAGKVEFNEVTFDLTKLLTSQKKTFAYKMQEKNVEVKLDIDPNINTQVIGDQQFVNQILLNLLGNASKFTNQGKIWIQAKIEKETPDFVFIQFTIGDTGVGIDPAYLDQIFDSFKQADNNTSILYGGTGLGLSIVKHLVEIHGGNIAVSSELHKGTEFRFCIPFKRTNLALMPDKKEKKEVFIESLSGLDVLIAEDNLMNQKFLSKVLEKAGIVYTVCENGKLALDALRRKHFDLVLMDIQMPEMDGYQATNAIRELDGLNRDIPIIALTASALVDERKRVLKAGMNDHLSKPFSPQQLYTIIQNTIDPSATGINEFELDHKYLTDFYGSDGDFKTEMLELFLKNMPDELENLDLALSTNNQMATYHWAHKNKSAFLMAGLGSLEPMIQTLENMAKLGNPEYQAVAANLKEKLPMAIQAVKNELKK